MKGRTIWIPKDNMIEGAWYVCDGRNFTIGQWVEGRFEYIREKFGHRFIDYEQHWDDGPPYGTVKPVHVIDIRNILHGD